MLDGECLFEQTKKKSVEGQKYMTILSEKAPKKSQIWILTVHFRFLNTLMICTVRLLCSSAAHSTFWKTFNFLSDVEFGVLIVCA